MIDLHSSHVSPSVSQPFLQNTRPTQIQQTVNNSGRTYYPFINYFTQKIHDFNTNIFQKIIILYFSFLFPERWI